MNQINTNQQGSTKHLPFKQRYSQEYKIKLKGLVTKYPKLSYSLGDMTLAVNITDIFQTIGFEANAQAKQEAKTLLQSVVVYLKEGQLVLLNYRPVSSEYSLLDLLKVIKKNVPDYAIQNLVPVFMHSYSSQKQHQIFKLMGTYGIQYASFLTPNAAVDVNVKEILEDLVSFSTLLKKTAPAQQETSMDKEEDEKDIEKIKKYRSFVSKGEELMKENNYERAIEFFTSAINLKPDVESLTNRGDAYYHSKQFIPALTDYREAFKLEQSLPEPHAKISSCCFALIKENMKKGGPEKSKTWFTLAMRHLTDAKRLIDKTKLVYSANPEVLPKALYAPVVNALTEADFRGLGFKEAEDQVADLAIKVLHETDTLEYLDSDVDVDTRIDQAILLTRNKEYEKAEKIFRELVDQEPENAGPAFNNFAVELRKNGEEDKAFQIYKELLRFDIPDKDIVVENLKTAGLNYAAKLRDDFKSEEAISVYKNILSHSPKGKEWILCDLAMAYLELQNQAQASCRMMEAIYVNPRLTELEKFQQSYSDLLSLKEEMFKKLVGMTDSQR